VALTAVADVVAATSRRIPGGDAVRDDRVVVPLETFPDTYNGQPLGLAALASQKQYMSLYLNNVYGDPELEAWFRGRFEDAGKKLDMGKSCVRFRQLDDLALNVIGEAIARSDLDDYLARYLQARGSSTQHTKDRRPMKLADWLDEYRALQPRLRRADGRRARGRLAGGGDPRLARSGP
jgi:hypothetical protein